MKRLPMTPDNYHAFVDGRKTVTRRIINLPRPYYKHEEKVVVVTRWAAFPKFDNRKPSEIIDYYPIFVGNECPKNYKHRPARFLPIHLEHHFPNAEIVSVIAERLQEITEEDAILEGIERVGGKYSCCPWRNYLLGKPGEMKMHCSSPIRSYQTLWDSIYKTKWHQNPWVWRIEFKKCEP